jgi:hypothetical protein
LLPRGNAAALAAYVDARFTVRGLRALLLLMLWTKNGSSFADACLLCALIVFA